MFGEHINIVRYNRLLDVCRKLLSPQIPFYSIDQLIVFVDMSQGNFNTGEEEEFIFSTKEKLFFVLSY